jgi:hypothetical protein
MCVGGAQLQEELLGGDGAAAYDALVDALVAAGCDADEPPAF